jgi:hypothetical protein
LVRRLLQIEGNLPNTFVGDDNNDIDNIEEINFDIRTRLMEHKAGGPDQKLAQYLRELPRYITSQNFSNSQQLLAQYGNLFQDIQTAQQQQYAEARGINKKNLFN